MIPNEHRFYVNFTKINKSRGTLMLAFQHFVEALICYGDQMTRNGSTDWKWYPKLHCPWLNFILSFIFNFQCEEKKKKKKRYFFWMPIYLLRMRVICIIISIQRVKSVHIGIFCMCHMFTINDAWPMHSWRNCRWIFSSQRWTNRNAGKSCRSWNIA